MIKKIAIVGQRIAPEHFPYIEEFIKKCYLHNIKVFIYESLKEDLKPISGLISFKAFKGDDLQNIDFVVSIGGDGTFLRTAQLVNSHEYPILGVNTGRLGFLAENGIHELSEVLEELLNNECSVAERTVLSVTENDKTVEQFALNDVTLYKRDIASLIVSKVKVNGMLLNDYWSDGIIVSTPTGSTAYSMSAGGPIVYPKSNNIIITPIAPHSFTVRPLVLPDDVELEITVESRTDNVMLTIDSTTNVINTETKIKIRKADYKVHVIQRSSSNFFDTLRKKLLWGEDVRTRNK